MTTQTCDVPPAVNGQTPFADVWMAELEQLAPKQRDWVWPGYLARGSMTLFTSQWKAGKTTLVSLLLSRFKAGGDLGGLAVQPARAVVVTEEPLELWRERHERLRFGPDTCFLSRPFLGKPSREQWQALVDHVRQLHERRGMDLLVVDSLSRLLPPLTEINLERMQVALVPLSRLTEAGMSVLLLHHPRKGDVLAGQAARGSGALCAFVDVLLELYFRRGADGEDRVRRLLAWSRYAETTRERLMELSADGLEYRLCESEEDEPFEIGWSLIEDVVSTRWGQKLSRQQFYEHWPERRKPDRITLWRWLDRAVSLGRLCQEGEGHRHDPYRYWLPGDNALWLPDRFSLPSLPNTRPQSSGSQPDGVDDDLDDMDEDFDDNDFEEAEV